MATNTTDVEKRLWDAADELRANSKLKSSEYSVPVLGLIFLRYADAKFAAAEKELAGKGTGRREIGKTDYQARGGFRRLSIRPNWACRSSTCSRIALPATIMNRVALSDPSGSPYFPSSHRPKITLSSILAFPHIEMRERFVSIPNRR